MGSNFIEDAEFDAIHSRWDDIRHLEAPSRLDDAETLTRLEASLLHDDMTLADRKMISREVFRLRTKLNGY